MQPRSHMMRAFRAIRAYFGGRRVRDSGRWQLANLRRSYVFGAISRAERAVSITPRSPVRPGGAGPTGCTSPRPRALRAIRENVRWISAPCPSSASNRTCRRCRAASRFKAVPHVPSGFVWKRFKDFARKRPVNAAATVRRPLPLLKLRLQQRPMAGIVEEGSLPGLTGYEVARRIRAGERAATRCGSSRPRSGQAEDRQRAHLTESVSPERLAEQIGAGRGTPRSLTESSGYRRIGMATGRGLR